MSIRMRQTHAKTRKRRSHHGLSEARISQCENCDAMHLRHRACDECGKYRGKEVLNTTKKLEKKMQKENRRDEAAQEEDAAAEKENAA